VQHFFSVNLLQHSNDSKRLFAVILATSQLLNQKTVHKSCWNELTNITENKGFMPEKNAETEKNYYQCLVAMVLKQLA